MFLKLDNLKRKIKIFVKKTLDLTLFPVFHNVSVNFSPSIIEETK